MYIVRDIFQLKFGHYRDAKALIDEAMQKKMFPDNEGVRFLTDFTGDAYRLILEQGFKTLGAYEEHLTSGMNSPEWPGWYNRFKEHAISSHREILKQIM